MDGELRETHFAEERAPLGQRDREELRFSPQPPLDAPSPLQTTGAEPLEAGPEAKEGEEMEPRPESSDGTEGEARKETEEDAENDRRAELTRGLAALAEDGWTGEELTAFSQDEQAARDIAAGKSLESAALRYLRRAHAAGNGSKTAAAPQRRAGVPTVRSAGTGETDGGNPIDRMSDREFDAFYARAMEKAMTGERVRI